MPRTSDFVRSGITVSALRSRFPQTTTLLDSFELPADAENCPIEEAAEMADLQPEQVMEALNRLVALLPARRRHEKKVC